MPNPNFILKPEWQLLTTFVPNKHLPVYNWFYYKEGFSRDLAMKFLGEWEPKTALDPFCGVGTTLVACKELGIDAIGFDVSPVCLLASRVKTRDYNLAELRKAIEKIKKSKFEMPDKSEISKYIKRFFNPHILDDVLFFRKFIYESFKGNIYDFLLLGLINATTKCSYLYKDGAVLKVKKHPIPPFRKYYLSVLNRMLFDLRAAAGFGRNIDSGEVGEKIQFKPCRIAVEETDARDMGNLEDNTIDCVITSPPYLNKIEYSKVYGIEEMLFFNKPENTPIRSFIGTNYETAERVFPELNLPIEANAYLLDLKKVLEELYRVCKPGANLAVVIGTAWFGDRNNPEKSVHVECDVLLSKLAEEIGFKTERIYIVAERFFTIDRVVKIGKARESIVVMRKG